MYELVKITDKTCYIDCPAKIGIYRFSENGVYLIDSGELTAEFSENRLLWRKK